MKKASGKDSPMCFPRVVVPGCSCVGVDVVFVPDFAQQLASPGTHFARVFTPYEQRCVHRRAAVTGCPKQHFAVRWAAKEAFIKAWSAFIAPAPPPLAPEEVCWSEIEVRNDAHGRPSLHLRGDIARLAPSDVSWDVSLSHDGDYAVAVVVAQREVGDGIPS